MKIFILLILFLGSISTFTFTQTNIPAGNVSGTWILAKSPYYINGEITIPDDSTLTIEQGVEVVFTGHYKLNVQGRLLAIGTKTDSIRFTADDKNAGWHGIRFINTPNTNKISKLEYCSFKYGKANTGALNSLDRCGGAIMINRFDSVLVSHCLFDSNMASGDKGTTGGAGICIFYGSPTISENTFSNNDGSQSSAGALVVDFTSKALIKNNIFYNNKSEYGTIICAFGNDNQPIISGNIISYNAANTCAGGIFVYSSSNPSIENNIIIHNQASFGAGVMIYESGKAKLINNTIAYNHATSGGGLYCEKYDDPILINNILWGNSAVSGKQVYLNHSQADPVFFNCDIEGGMEGFSGVGAGFEYNGLFKNNIDEDPLFAKYEADDFSLSNISWCIGVGIDSIEIEGTMYHCPLFCIKGNLRPSPAGTKPDIGACENPLGTFVNVEEKIKTPINFMLYQNYPNPFNPTTAISYQLSAFSHVILKIYDILGREVSTLVNEEKPVGIYEVTWNAVDLTSGVYFYQLKAVPQNGRHSSDYPDRSGHDIETKKMVLLR